MINFIEQEAAEKAEEIDTKVSLIRCIYESESS